MLHPHFCCFLPCFLPFVGIYSRPFVLHYSYSLRVSWDLAPSITVLNIDILRVLTSFSMIISVFVCEQF
jgi:hypothetical protein